jgi:CheY-like chemotaxis protein
MADLIKEFIKFMKTHLSTEAFGIVLLCLCGVYIWYQHLRNKLLREQIDIDKQKGQEFLETARKLKQPTNGRRDTNKRLISLTESVLLVDDEELMLMVIAEMLRAEQPNLLVVTASDGEEALRKIDHQIPSILITDIAMPKLDGIELLKTLYAKGIKPPTLVISGYFFPEDFERLLSDEGISDRKQILFLQKPFRLEDLKAMLEKLKKGKSKTKKL